MISRKPVAVMVLGLALTFIPSTGRAQEEKNFQKMTAEQIEEILSKMKIAFKKTASKTQGTFYYDFDRNKQVLRLHFFNGEDIMLDVEYPAYSLEVLNNWNKKAKFSRACQHKDSKGEFCTLESNLDLLGGVSEGTVVQFFNTFYDEVQAFEKHLGSTPLAASKEPVYRKVTSERLEKILADLRIAYKKTPLKGQTGDYYDFEFNNNKLRLYNYGGVDLMLDAVFRKVPLEAANKYNLDRKFIRVVTYNLGQPNEYSSLETNLDCSAGVSDAIIRHFITTFDIEIAQYQKFLARGN